MTQTWFDDVSPPGLSSSMSSPAQYSLALILRKFQKHHSAFPSVLPPGLWISVPAEQKWLQKEFLSSESSLTWVWFRETS